jgi:hypothetical protein
MLLTQYFSAHGVSVKSYEFAYPPDPLAPLSWHMTPAQKQKITEAWSNPSPDLKRSQTAVYSALGCQEKP